MGTRKLFFEEVAKSSSVINKDTIPNWPTGHSNAGRGYRTDIYRKGRYDQTEGNIFGDTYPDTPACPYHMPRRSGRFDDPRLHISKKNAGDIIEAKDINNLIDKIKLYNEVWEAEANNIYGYSAVTGRANVPVNISKLNYINATDQDTGAIIPQPKQTNYDASYLPREVTIPKLAIMYTYSGNSEVEVRTKLQDALTNKKSNLAVNTLNAADPNIQGFGINQVGFPEFIPSGWIASDAHTTLSDGYTTKTMNSGFNKQVSTSFIQTSKNADTYFLKYLSGTNKGQYVKDINGQQIEFESNKIYIQSYIPSDESTSTRYGDKEIIPSTLYSRDKFNGFVLYWINPIQAFVPSSQVITEVYTEGTTYGLGGYGPLVYIRDSALGKMTYQNDPNVGITVAGVTEEVNFDLLKTLTNIFTPAGTWVVNDDPNAYAGVVFWEQINTSVAINMSSIEKKNYIIDTLKTFPVNKIKIAKQKVNEYKCYRQEPDGSWAQQNALYSLETITPVFLRSKNYDFNNEYDYTPTVGFNIVVRCWNPDTNMTGLCSLTVAKPITNSTYWWLNSYETDPSFFGNILAWIDARFSNFQPISGYQSKEGFILTTNNLVGSAVYSTDPETGELYQTGSSYFTEDGIHVVDTITGFFSTRRYSFGQRKLFYVAGNACSDGSLPDSNGICTITNKYTVYYNDVVSSETSTTMTIRENDFTYTKDDYFIGNGLYPTIKGVDYSNIRNVLNSYLQSILVMAQTGINNGSVDTATIQEIGAFSISQAQQSSTFNPDDPDATFFGYQAISNGIIKLDFYNTLVDAYKIMINSCICNADCACNLVCACNINCGCNY